jgi:regulator of sigma E protease
VYGISFSNKRNTGFVNSLKYMFTKFASIYRSMVNIILNLFTGHLGINSLSGPVGIYSVVGEQAKTGFANLIYLIAFLSINVGFVNLIPFPAFDGGRALFLIIEKIRKKPISQKTENTIHSIGFILLMILVLVITVNDIIKLF